MRIAAILILVLSLLVIAASLTGFRQVRGRSESPRRPGQRKRRASIWASPIWNVIGVLAGVVGSIVGVIGLFK
jgi:uncharacterized membrane protein YfcA